MKSSSVAYSHNCWFSGVNSIYYITELGRELKERLKDIAIIGDFDIHKRMTIVNLALVRLFKIMEVMKDFSRKIQNNQSEVSLSTQDLDYIASLVEEVAGTIFVACNAKVPSLERYIRDEKIDKFPDEFARGLKKTKSKEKYGESDNPKSA